MKLVLEDSQGRADVIAGQAEFLVQLFSNMLKNDMQIQKFSEHMIFINPTEREFIRDKFCQFDMAVLHPWCPMAGGISRKCKNSIQFSQK